MTDLEARRPIRATFYELGLCSEEPQRLAAFYGTALGYGFAEVSDGLLGTALDRRLRIKPGKSRTIAHAAYAVDDVHELAALKRRLNYAGVAFEDLHTEGLGQAITVHDPDGNRFVFGVAEATVRMFGAVDGDDQPARIQHVVFASTDAERLLRFFTEVIGFTLSDRVLDEQGGLRTAFVRCSHEHHSLAVFAANENRLDHHCYEAGDWHLIRDWADHFAKHRIPLKWGPGRHGPGNNLFLFIHDVDGNWVEISAELESVQPDRPVGDWPHEEYTLNSWGMGLLRS